MSKPIKVTLLEKYLKLAFPPYLFNYHIDEDKKPYDTYIEKVAGEIFFDFIIKKESNLNEQNSNI